MDVQRNSAYLEIVEQPKGQIRFRYESGHGKLTGQQEDTFPTVCLRNFNGEASILCSLYQMEKPNGMQCPHPHSLIVRDGDVQKDDPHEVIVSQDRGYQAIFQGMSILHKKRGNFEDELFKKIVTKSEYECGHESTQEQLYFLRERAKMQAANVDPNQAVLCFEAYRWNNGQRVRLCEPVLSTPIYEISMNLYP